MAGSSSGRWPRLRVVRLLPVLDYGGVESRVTLQARLHTRAHLDLRVCTLDRAGAAADAIRRCNVPVDVIGLSPSVRNPRASVALARYLGTTRPDILHASVAEANFHALAASRFSSVPSVIVEETGMPSHGVLARVIFSVLYRRAAAIVGVTQAVCDYARSVDRAPADRVQLLYNCADPSFFPEERRLPNPDPPPRLLCIGRLVPVKNHAFLLGVFAEIARKHPDAELWIAGDGPLSDDLRRTAKGLGIQGNVRFLGYQADVGVLLSSCRAFLLPSISEGCSISLIEAMATGVLVLGSNVPGVREVMGNALASEWTAPVSDLNQWSKLLHRALTLPAPERIAIASAAQERAYSMFSPIAYVKRLEELYRGLSGNTGAAELQGATRLGPV